MSPSASLPPAIFDRKLLRRRLARAIAGGAEGFLLDHAADELIDRLSAVTRDFRRILDIGTPGASVAAALKRSRPGAEILRIAPVASAVGTGPWLGLVGDEERLPLAPASLDLAVSALSLQFANDLPGVLVQLRRALKPDGLLLAGLVGGRTLIELRGALTEAEGEIRGGASPRVAPFSDLRDLGHLLQRAGFALPVTETDAVTVRYRDPLALLRDLRRMGATNALVARSKEPLSRAVLGRALDLYRARHADPDGRVRATFEFVWISGWAPHESQQKPLAPGSATHPLSAALKPRR